MERRKLEHHTTRGIRPWVLQDDKFIEWEDNAGLLWIHGALIQKLSEDGNLFNDRNQAPPAIAFFYFDLTRQDTSSVATTLHTIVLQLSAQSPRPYKGLDDEYNLCNGQGLQYLQNILQQLLREIAGHTYIILDGLDECDDNDLDQLIDLVSSLRTWTETPLHLLITSRLLHIFKKRLEGVTYMFDQSFKRTSNHSLLLATSCRGCGYLAGERGDVGRGRRYSELEVGEIELTQYRSYDLHVIS
ncbi:hypothetical protein B0H13DRAFT_1893854 [Mycena leptocephala]|nr:hypothetical protein B0H13DRAFT_1893854 [Mycena leptocephala]